jgi:DNA-binding response OmpR family regulator
MTATPHKEKSILLIDDDKLLLDMYALKFKEATYSVTIAASVEDALSALEDETKWPSVILLDMIMPGVNGLEFFEKLQALVGNETSIIILSNQGDEVGIETAKRLGAAGYIVKANTIPSEVVKEVGGIIGHA